MVLRVALEDFAEAVRSYAQTDDAFVAHTSGGTQLSAVNPKSGVIVSATTDLAIKPTQALLEAAGLNVREGEWSKATESDVGPEVFVAAVAYRSKEPTPGLWVDTFHRLPTVMEVLRALHEEFVQTGEASSASFEQFVKSAQPNVVILTPDELRSFAGRKDN